MDYVEVNKNEILEIISEYCDDDLIKINIEDVDRIYNINLIEKKTDISILEIEIYYKESYIGIDINIQKIECYFNFMNKNITIGRDFSQIKNYLSNSLYNELIEIIPNINNKKWSEIFRKEIKKDPSIIKGMYIITRMNDELKGEYDYLINANKFDLI